MITIDKLIQLAAVVRQPGGLRALRRWRPFSIASFRMLAQLRQAGVDFRTIIDAGANVGQFARTAAEFYPEATVYSIEALPDAARRFRANLADRPSVRLLETALGNQVGTIQFFPNAYSQASSALPLVDAGQAQHTHVRQLAPIEVPVTRLDDLLAGEALTGPVLLKLDLQGFELEALRGAPATLAKCSHVLLETVFEAAYQGEPLFEDLRAYLGEHGFRFRKPLAFLKDDRGHIYQMDALFEGRDGAPAG